MNSPAAWTAQSLSRPSMMQLSMLTALAVGFRAAEVFIPTPLPWLRLGLANVVVLIVLASFGVRTALLVNVARILLASFVIGTFLSPGFWLSLCAGVVSCLSMALVWYCFGGWLSYIGISVVGAYCHTVAQFFVVYLLFVRHVAILKLMPYFLLVSLGTGTLTGLAATAILTWAKRHGILTARTSDHESAGKC
ncbi:MAG: hypothetical protein DRH70_03100 [Candidatus Coatesbacteria bacterium]|nr:MAG: hypothetical protein DRH70_03100 [Candidatus Coatesbacteria bacterium]